MNRTQYREVCEMTKKGEPRTILNLGNHTQGEVLSCHRNYFNVRVGKGWEVWDREVCEASMPARGRGENEMGNLDFQI